jgi:hypothetical protein
MPSLPPGIRAVVARLEVEPPRPPAELLRDLRGFELELEAEGRAHPFADHALARRIAAGCRTLLGDPDNQAPDRFRQVQTAIRYLVLGEDAESDRDSILGFDDDALVFDLVARSLGRPDLCVGEPPG